MRQLAESLGVSTGTLYHYFQSKKAIFEQLVRHMAQRDVAGLAEVMSPFEGIEAKLGAASHHIEQHGDYFRKQLLLFVEYARQLELQGDDQNSAIRIAFDDAFEPFQEMFIEQTGLDDPVLFKLIGCVFDGVLIQQIYSPDEIALSEVVGLFARMLTAYTHRKTSASAGDQGSAAHPGFGPLEDPSDVAPVAPDHVEPAHQAEDNKR